MLFCSRFNTYLLIPGPVQLSGQLAEVELFPMDGAGSSQQLKLKSSFQLKKEDCNKIQGVFRLQAMQYQRATGHLLWL